MLRVVFVGVVIAAGAAGLAGCAHNQPAAAEPTFLFLPNLPEPPLPQATPLPRPGGGGERGGASGSSQNLLPGYLPFFGM